MYTLPETRPKNSAASFFFLGHNQIFGHFFEKKYFATASKARYLCVLQFTQQYFCFST